MLKHAEIDSLVKNLKSPQNNGEKSQLTDETLQIVQQIYGVENWSADYFDINTKGNITVNPTRQPYQSADLKEIVDHLLHRKKLQLPILLRFPQILKSQIFELAQAYSNAIDEFDYHGSHFPVYPMKVNPRREVVSEFLRSDSQLKIGLECGSKAELFAAIAQQQSNESLLLCNGFKDESFVRIAMLGILAGKSVTLVVEKLNELRTIIDLAKQTGVKPLVGLRAKIYSRGAGKWASSGGEAAKFGLTTTELLACVNELDRSGLLSQLRLLHFHIGSQITDIKRVKKAMKEAARVYAKLRQKGCEIDFLDIGGGLGVDYDGSKTRYESSVNYTVQEFANDVIYTVKSVCDEESVPVPNIVTESGRYMTAYHSVLITSIRDEIETFADKRPEVQIDDDDPQVITELKEIYDSINGKNFVEYYHDALEYKDSLHTQFNLGLISLEDRSKGEVLFWEICNLASKESESKRMRGDEFEDLKTNLATKYLCNFSTFRSAPDSWAIDQLFPVVPLHRLNEVPTDYATLVDVTCDSDGKIDRFVDLKDVKETLQLHDWENGQPYYIGIFLVGAYQEVMGNSHNLFGTPDEAHIVVDRDGQYHITKCIRGSNIKDMISLARFDEDQLLASYEQLLKKQCDLGNLEPSEAKALAEQYSQVANQSTYLT